MDDVRPCSEERGREILGYVRRNGWLGRGLLLLSAVYFVGAWQFLHAADRREARLLGGLAYALGLILLLWAGACLARAKGRSGFWGLLSLGCVVGPAVLRFLPSKCHHCGRMEPRPPLRCPACRAPF